MSPSESNWSFSRNFTSQFQASRSDLESRVVAASKSPSPETIQDLSISLANLTKTLADATGSLPSYDQKQYELQLKGLEGSIEALRASNAPKSKFAFKRKPAAATPPSEIRPKQKAPPVELNPQSASTHLSLSSRSYSYLTRDALPGRQEQSDLSISDLDHCIVNLLPSSSEAPLVISALHARNITDSILLLPIIDGSALIHDLSRCVVVLGCHQFRMHASKKVDVHLSISSNPIIEDCKEIRFSRYPKSLAPSSVTEKQLATFTVQDFSHIRATPSPNYIVRDGADIDVNEWPLAAISGEELEQELAKLIPHSSDQGL